MKLFEFFDKMKLFNRLIEQERTGTPEEFALRLNTYPTVSVGLNVGIVGELNKKATLSDI